MNPNTTEGLVVSTEESAVVAAVMAGDETAFGQMVERYRRQLQVHCYRMLGSFDDAEDMVQETFLRAWKKRDTYEARSTFRAWLYRIATNACLDLIDHRRRQPVPREMTPGSVTQPDEIAWLQPFPDRLLDDLAASDTEPHTAAINRETIELAFLAAIQHLPARQRAVLILRDVLGWSAKETATLLETSVASVNSALQRARPTLKEHLPERRMEWAPDTDPSEAERALLQRYMDAHERVDLAALPTLLREDARLTMPPDPALYFGREAIAEFAEKVLGGGRFGEFRTVLTRANRQPAVAKYIRRSGDTEFRPQSLDVLRIEEGQIVEIVTFVPDLFKPFGLPAVL
jgi:RNA polymerase sigma-70 factor, ECF subfamily